MIQATRVGTHRDIETGHHACPRCGVIRAARNTTILCADCSYTLTKDQARLWATA